MTHGSACDLVVVGSCMTDLVTTVPRLPMLGETLEGVSFTVGFGGKGANQAVQASRLGARVAMVACVGDDDFGRTTLENFAHQGIDARFVTVVSGQPTGVAPITVTADGHNTVIIVPGANLHLDAAAVERALVALPRPKVIACQLEVPDAASERALRWGQEHGVITLLNPAPAKMTTASLLGYADILVPNETELALLTGMDISDGFTHIATAARRLRQRSDQCVVVTLGARGVWLLEGNSESHIAAPRVRAVDSTGAGDSFIGALAYRLSQSIPLRDAVAWGCRVAAASVRQPGTQSSYLNASQLHNLP